MGIKPNSGAVIQGIAKVFMWIGIVGSAILAMSAGLAVGSSNVLLGLLIGVVIIGHRRADLLALHPAFTGLWRAGTVRRRDGFLFKGTCSCSAAGQAVLSGSIHCTAQYVQTFVQIFLALCKVRI